MAAESPVPYQHRVHRMFTFSLLDYEMYNGIKLRPRYTRSKAMAPRSRLETIGHDILSIIFEFCALMDWTSPLDIAEVCRTWRTVVLATPRAWNHLDTISPLPDKGVRLFLERSGQCRMHLCIPSSRSPTLLTNIAHRIVCLNLRHMVNYPMEVVFPVLARLRFEVDDPIPAAHITTHRYPALRHLMFWNSRLLGPFQAGEFPALSTLVVTASPNDRAWMDAIIATRNSLVSLSIIKRVNTIRTVAECEISLPRLVNLKIWDWTMGFPCPILLHTPRLTTYADHVYWMTTTHPTHSDVSTVTHAHLTKPPLMTKYTSLIHLQYDGSAVSCLSILLQLDIHQHACPHLELFEIYSSTLSPMDISDLQTKADRVNTNRKNPFRLVFSELADPFPGDCKVYLAADEYNCGHGWH